MNAIFTEDDIISRYTRADAIAEGVLVDISANFPITRRLYKFPVAFTASVWTIIESTGNENLIGEVIAVLVASQRNQIKELDESTMLFQVILENAAPTERLTLKIMCHGGDEGEPVLTVMLPNED